MSSDPKSPSPEIVEPRPASGASEGPGELSQGCQDSSLECRETSPPEDEALSEAARAVLRGARKKPRKTPSAAKAKAARHADGVPLRHLLDAPKATSTPVPARAASRLPENTPWRPGLPKPAGRPKERTFAEDARDVLTHGVPLKLRALVALRTGMPIEVAAHMSLRQAVILLLIHDAVERGQMDKLDRILDRTDPKSRRVEHAGGVAHLHALAGRVMDMSAGEATELYRQMVQGGTGAVIEAEVLSDEAD